LVTEQGNSGELPKVDLQQAPKVFRAIHACIQNGLLRSCHDLSEGGLAVALSEMAFAGGLGVDVSLDALSVDTQIAQSHVLLFSESNTRFLVEVAPASAEDFSRTVSSLTGKAPVPLGAVTQDGKVTISFGKQVLVDESILELKECWQSPLRWD
jgi:phosphoribosylformylglycinamidine synthase